MEILLLASLLGLIATAEIFASGQGASNDQDGEDELRKHETSDDDGPIRDLTDGLRDGDQERLSPTAIGNGAREIGPFVEPGTNILGTIGADTITGWNELYGGDGDDYIRLNNFGGEYQAVGTAYGGLGDDTVLAEAGNDNDGILFGGAGDDLLVGHAGAHFDAGSGNDTIVALSTISQDGQIVTGSGNDLLIIQPFTTKFDESSAQEVVNLRVEDFDAAKDSLGILLDPYRIGDLNLTAETVNGGNDTKLSLFLSNMFDGIETNAPIEVIITGVSNTANLDLKLYKMINETEYECYGTMTVAPFI